MFSELLSPETMPRFNVSSHENKLLLHLVLFRYSLLQTKRGSTETIPLSTLFKTILLGTCIHLVGGANPFVNPSGKIGGVRY